MPREIIKPEPDRDFYIEWSSIVEAPICFGDRAFMLAHVEGGPGNPISARLDRADRTGSSSLVPQIASVFGEDEIYQQQGVIPRRNMIALCERLAVDGDADVSDLLVPFEDDAAAVSS